MATFAPSRAKIIAISLPIPLAAPVMITTLSFRRTEILLNTWVSGEVVVNDLAETEREVGHDVSCSDDFQHRQLG